MNTIESNKLIAEFMGYVQSDHLDFPYIFKNIDDSDVINIEREDWNFLMKAVKGIESIHDDHHGYFMVMISSNSCTIEGTNFKTTETFSLPIYHHTQYGESKIEAVYKSIVRFIKWYNDNLALNQ